MGSSTAVTPLSEFVKMVPEQAHFLTSAKAPPDRPQAKLPEILTDFRQ
jgi:hypothetical protein